MVTTIATPVDNSDINDVVSSNGHNKISLISVNKDKKSYGLSQRRLTSLSLRRRHCSLLRRTICTLRKLGRRASSQGSRHWIQSTLILRLRLRSLIHLLEPETRLKYCTLDSETCLWIVDTLMELSGFGVFVVIIEEEKT
ncbi:BnaA08g03130D [Brassica napus]|uniref:BnaA08g03130D protein n=1 Tax=Brassica napus TaxID=3708 RepID=A0A078FU20_BRANA|nr:BnaA08g03130D [Brassica napus]